MMCLGLTIILLTGPQSHAPPRLLPSTDHSTWLGYEISHGNWEWGERFYKKFKRVRYPIAKGDRPPDAMAIAVATARYPVNVTHVKKCVDWLLARGATPNGYKGAPIRNAVFQESGELLQYLLKKGASPHLFDSEKDAPLFSAMDTGAHKIIGILLGKKVDVNRQVSKEGKTPLMWAAQHGDEGLAVRLIAAGAKLNIQQRRTERTALHWAVTNDQASMVALLLRHGAKKSIRELNGQTPFEMASKLKSAKSMKKLHD